MKCEGAFNDKTHFRLLHLYPDAIAGGVWERAWTVTHTASSTTGHGNSYANTIAADTHAQAAYTNAHPNPDPHAFASSFH